MEIHSLLSILIIMGQHPSSSKVYFPGLNALRFFAASVVVFSHVELMKNDLHLPYYPSNFLRDASGMAVTFFFALSGFLISFLLFKEKEQYQSIDVKKFYIRRILRVWPLYYLLVFLGFAVLPNLSVFYIPKISENIGLQMPYNLIFYLTLLPNVANLFGISVAYAGPLWSIGVEEQFYLFWPWLLKKKHRYEQLFFIIIITFIAIRNTSSFLASHLHIVKVANFFEMINILLMMTRIDCMAIGGLAALYIYQKKSWFLKYFVNRQAEALSLAAIVCIAAFGIYIPYINHDFFAIVFSLFIVNTSCNPKSLFRLEGKVWTSLGNVSYGIYMYHLVAIGIMLAAFRALGVVEFPVGINILLHLGSLLLAIAIAQLSYRLFEMPFLHLKERMTRVKSGSMSTE